ncbi:hypothetical protein P4U63_27845, partial [Bacillus paranthracis]|nr:hypothetical protein [Bacillus paranthracis]
VSGRYTTLINAIVSLNVIALKFIKKRIKIIPKIIIIFLFTLNRSHSKIPSLLIDFCKTKRSIIQTKDNKNDRITLIHESLPACCTSGDITNT